jgi:hypothetical protein
MPDCYRLLTKISLIMICVLMPFATVLGTEGEADIQVQDATICQDVVDRTPMGTGDVFPKEIEKLFCFTRIVGAQGTIEITHNWYYKGNLQASVPLKVDSTNWRTWSSKTMSSQMTGEWMVEVLSGDGIPLESIIFFIQ